MGAARVTVGSMNANETPAQPGNHWHRAPNVLGLTGITPGSPVDTLSNAVRAVTWLPDTADRARAATELIGGLLAAQDVLKGLRRDALATMSAGGMRNTEIGAATGLSRSRVSGIQNDRSGTAAERAARRADIYKGRAAI